MSGQIDKLMKDRGLDTGSSSVRSTAPNTSSTYSTSAGGINNDAIPQMNRYGAPPTTPTRDDEAYYSTYQPGDDAHRIVLPLQTYNSDD